MTVPLNMPMPVTGLLPGDVVLTGDRPTGPLHLGHLAGSLASRVAAQAVCAQTVLVADMQALTDHAHDVGRVRGNVLEVVKDYLAVGLDPDKSRFCLQSGVPELCEIAMLLMTVTGEGRALRNPTVRAEIEAKSFSGGVPLAFAVYPVSQAADILGFAATAVPVGDDQRPMIELAAEIGARLNEMGAGLPVPRGVYASGPAARLPGTDGRKASKTFGNAVPLSADRDGIAKAVKRMVSDASRKGPADPGDPDATVTFAYLRAFDADRDGLARLEADYRNGGIRDSDVKARVVDVLESLLAPVRERRAEVSDDEALRALREGTARARETVVEVLGKLRLCFGLGLL